MNLVVPSARGFATAPQGNVMQASHEHVTKLDAFPRNATNTFKCGEAELWQT